MGTVSWSKIDTNVLTFPMMEAEELAATRMRERIGSEPAPDCSKCIFWTQNDACWCRKHQFIEDAPDMRQLKKGKAWDVPTICKDYKYYPGYEAEEL